MPTFTEKSPSCQIPSLNEIYERMFPGITNGVFVEVGAFDGFEWSNTWGLAQTGWRGVCFEPVPAFAAKCRQRYAGNDRITVVESCVGATNGTAKLYTSSNPTINQETVDKQAWGMEYNRDESILCPVCTLDTALPAHNITPGFEVLSIDVEGAELEVLSGFDLTLWRPQLVILETCKHHPTDSYRFHSAAIENVMVVGGYREIYADHINSIFIRGDDARW
jgi:FkbM family methyltransferase